ncbi:MAG TPA: EamA family transporter [Candidatus Dormibacteraeota bacterium]|nr:EamA family transporter [Candidatus Dormibacteraeota bacterium]
MATERAPIVIEEAASGSLAPLFVRTHRFTVILCFLAIYLIWGSTYLAIRYAVESIPPLYTAGFRHLAAGTVLLLWCLAKRRHPTWAQIRASIIIGVFFFLIGHGALHWAEQKVPSGLASLLIASEPIWVFLLSAAAAKQWHWNVPLLAGIFLGLGGVGLLMGRSALTSVPGMFLSSLAVVISALSWSAGVVYSRRSNLSGSPLLLSALSLLAGSAQLLLVGTIAREYQRFSFASVSQRSWISLGYLIVFGSVVAFTAYNWLMEHYSPTLVATHTFVNPIVAVLLGWLLAGEAVTLNVLVSAAMVVSAVVLVDRGMARLPQRI